MPVPTALRPWVCGVNWSTFDREAQVLTEAPDPAITLAIRSWGDAAGDAVIAGPRSRAIHYMAEPGPSCLQLRMRPGSVPLALTSLRDMVDRVLPLGHGAEALLDVFTVRKGGDPVNDELLETAASLLAQGTRVRSVAHQLHISERHLRNLFGRMIGLSPKQFTRINRVRTVVATLGDGDLSQLAVTAGYYDQAHMTTEFRQLMGITPAAFAAGQRPRPAPCDHRPPVPVPGDPPSLNRRSPSEPQQTLSRLIEHLRAQP